MQLQAPAADAQDNGYYRRNKRSRAKASATDHTMLIGVSDNLMAIAWNQEDLDAVAKRLADPARDNSGNLADKVTAAYKDGVNYLLCVNMEHIARHLVDTNKDQPKPQLPTGLGGMRYLIVERKDVAGRTENQATLTFGGNRSGMAAWLAEPSPMGTLDFVSPNATFAMSLALERPQSMLSDIFRQMSQSDPTFDEKLERFRRDSGIVLSPMLGEPLGGEFTFALDGPMLPLPSWKMIAEVYSTDRLQWAIEQLIAATNKDMKCADCTLHLAKTDEGGRTYYTITSDKISYEIDYTYVDGYIVIAPSRTLLARAIQNRETGYMLSRSEAFRSQLPKDGRLNFSALIYNNIGSALSPIAEQLSSTAAATPAQRESMKALAANSGPGLIYAYGQPESITIASSSSFFGLDLNSFALPHLMRSVVPHSTDAKTKPMSTTIELAGLEVRLASRTILNELTCSLSGRTIGLLGPNGAGKSTLINTLLGFHKPARGTARVLGLDIRTQLDQIRSIVGFMPENDCFIANMTAVAFVQMMAELSGLPRDAALERAHEALFYVGLGEARYRKLGTYSLGMKQLAKLAQAIAHGPQLVILDEPTNGLDPPARQRMIRMIREMKESGDVRIVLCSHLLRDVEEACEEVLILKQGRIVHYSNLEQERKANLRFVEIETRGDDNGFIEALEQLGCECAASGDRRLKMVLSDGLEIRDIYRVADGCNIQLRRLNYRRDTLEDIFLKAMEATSGRS